MEKKDRLVDEKAVEEELESKEEDEDLEDEELSEDDSQVLEEELEDMKNNFLRLQADFTNYKKRIEKEKSNIIKYASEELMKELLFVVDNLERALESKKEKDGFSEGIENIYEEFLRILEKNGLSEIEALEKEFDPNLHNAVIMEDSDEYETDTVVEVFEKGYKLNGKVIRPSMVKVAK